MPKSVTNHCLDAIPDGWEALSLAIKVTRWKEIAAGRILADRDEDLPVEVRRAATFRLDAPDWSAAVSKGWLESKEGQAWLTN